MTRQGSWWVALFLLAFVGGVALAEPAFAVRTGHRCSTCHVNRSGGGLRTPFGSLYTQTTLPQQQLRWRDGGNLLPADPDARFHFGGNFRASLLTVNASGGEDTSSFEIPEANLYGQVRLVPGRLSVYLDEKVGPSGASAREIFGLWEFRRGDGYVKVGKFLPPFGWRLPDDDAFIRQFTGFSYSAPDTGIEVGFEPGHWSIHLAAVNGAGGASDDNRSKQLSALALRRFGRGRLGVSVSNNEPQGTRIRQAGLLAGLQFGRLTLLGEADYRETRTEGAVRDRWVGLVEADLLVSRGFNIKVAHDVFDPDRDMATDAITRSSIGVEYIPYPFVQLRYFVRFRDGPEQTPGAKDNEVLAEAHFFF